MNTRSEKMAYQTVPPRLSVVFMGSGLGPFGPPRNDDGGSCGFTPATVHARESRPVCCGCGAVQNLTSKFSDL